MNKKCYNCKFSGDQFKISGMTHCHCHNPVDYPEKDMKEGKISTWDTLREFWHTCERWELKGRDKRKS